jgi:hypothetical protein
MMKGFKKEGGDILFHQMAVPSALTGLTTLFGMVRGEPRCYSHLNSWLIVFGYLLIVEHH